MMEVDETNGGEVTAAEALKKKAVAAATTTTTKPVKSKGHAEKQEETEKESHPNGESAASPEGNGTSSVGGKETEVVEENGDAGDDSREAKVAVEGGSENGDDPETNSVDGHVKGGVKDDVDSKSDAEDGNDDVKDGKKDSEDVKKDAREVKKDAREVKKDAKDVKKDAKDGKSDVNDFKNDVNDGKGDVKEIQKDGKDSKKAVKDCKSDANDHKNDVKDSKSDVKGGKSDVASDDGDSADGVGDSKIVDGDKDEKSDSNDVEGDSKVGDGDENDEESMDVDVAVKDVAKGKSPVEEKVSKKVVSVPSEKNAKDTEEADESDDVETKERPAKRRKIEVDEPASDDAAMKSGDSEADEEEGGDDEDETATATKEEGGKKQTIIITETKSLAKAIHDAAREPDDGKPTLVIIESKSKSEATVTEKSTTVSPGKSLVRSVMTTRSATHSLPAGHNSLRSALLQGSSAARGQSSSGGARSGGASGRPAKPDPSQGVALQDDAEVSVYTPSLVVPYLFECPPKENLADFVAKIAPPPPPKKKVVKTGEEEYVADEEEDDDDDDDEEEEGVAEPIKPKPIVKNFFESALGAFFVDIGLSQVQQWVQSEILKAQKRKLDRGWKTKERENIVSDLQRTLGAMKARNKPFQFKSKKCGRCNFVTESKTVLDRHLETIHVVGHRMQCSFCKFDTLDPSQIFQHLYSMHKAFGRLERPPTCHMCPLCPFEDSGKARVTRHAWKCQKTFAAEKNLAPTPDWEPPAKRTRHVASVATLKALRSGGSSSSGASPASNASPGTRVSGQVQQISRVRPSIVPKPADVRLTPAYVQSVLRGQYMQQQGRGALPNIIRGAVSFAARGQLQSAQQRVTAPGAYILPRQQVMGGATTLTPVSAAAGPATAYLQGNQLYQVVRTSVGPVLRNAAPATTTFTPPRFTILPQTVSSSGNRGGPTPVALIPNLASSGSQSVVHASAGKQPQVYPVSRHGSSPAVGNRLQPQLGSAKPNISITPVANKPGARLTTVSSTPGARLATQQQLQRGGVAGASSARPVQPPAGAVARPAQPQGGAGGANPSYVVCEICDGYIKDLDQLRNHMQWIHKVKIHPKMIHNRPPLNCQKCHYRFFTDQGLERHLLGSHGLVTSSMQENANKGKDGGRCTICGKVFLWKLVVHMAKDHRMTLKPAHLSYKCTVCSATFNMYRLFETHVYEEHSTVAKRVLDGPNKPVPAAFPAKGAVAAVSSSSKSSPAVAAAALVRKEAAASASPGSVGGVESRLKECVECGAEFRCTDNCISHYEKNHLKPCQVKLCRVDKCQSCAAKKGRADGAAASSSSSSRKQREPAAEEDDDDDDVRELTPPPKTKRQPRDDEVETVEDDDDEVEEEPTENGKAEPSPSVDRPSLRPKAAPSSSSSSSTKKQPKETSDVESPDPPAKRARLEVSEPRRESPRRQSVQPPPVPSKVVAAAAEPSKKPSDLSSKKVSESSSSASATKKASSTAPPMSESKKPEAPATRRAAEAAKKKLPNSDDDDMFDMEVETVDEEVQSEVNTDVESD